MVDVGHDIGPNDKSTAYTELANKLWQRDGEGTYELTLLDHSQKLQKIYSNSLKQGWDRVEMKLEASMAWLADNVAWWVGRACMVDYDDDYYRLLTGVHLFESVSA